MKGYPPKFLIFVVYKKASNNWRGFCFPYDVTCETETKKEAMNRLEKLVKLYDEGLKKYGYPKHLSVRQLSNPKDRIVLAKVEEKIISDIKRDFLRFQAEKQKEEFRIGGAMSLSGYYLCPVPA